MSFTIQNELDNNENPVIQGLEALLICDDPHEEPFCESFEDMRTKLKHSFSLDQSKDSGIVFSNLSLKQIPSVNSSIQNQSIESGYSGELFDPFSFKSSVKNVSFDGCFVEDDFASAGNFPSKYQRSKWSTATNTGILSSAISHGGDIKCKSVPHPSINIHDPYAMVKFMNLMKKCWNSISCINKLSTQLTQKVQDLDNPREWSLVCLLDVFKKEVVKLASHFAQCDKLAAILYSTLNFLEFIYSNLDSKNMDCKTLKQLQILIDNLLVVLYSQCILQNSLSTPSEDEFRSEKHSQVWSRLAH